MKLAAKCAFVLVMLAGVALGQRPAATLVLTGAKVYVSPTEAPIEDATVVVQDGKIARVERGKVRVQDAEVIDCKGKVVVAGFWNSHVHFESGWDNAASAPAAGLTGHMQAMLTRWGFTTVWDLGSDPANTQALRKRVEAGEVPGPRILMAGDIFPKGGHPVYLPPEMQLPEAATPEQAQGMARWYMQWADGVKLFTGAFMGDRPVINMPTPIVKAAADVAHAQGKPVFAHPQNRTGVDNALAGGVDVLAHTIPTEGKFTEDELARAKRQHAALIPTLALWTTVTSDPRAIEQLVDAGAAELKQYRDAGGTILFGTDVGFTSQFDTTQEYEFMGRVLPWREVLASLTTAPAAFFRAPNKGRVEKGMDADLVVLAGDPATDVRNLARVDYTIRAGRLIYSRTQ